MRVWIPPLIGAIAYPGLIVSGDWALRRYRESAAGSEIGGEMLIAVLAFVVIVLATSVPLVALRSLLRTRDDASLVRARVVSYVVFSTPSLFSLTYSLSRLVGISQYISALWIVAWFAVGTLLYFTEHLYFKERAGTSVALSRSPPRRLRIVHGATALCVLLGFIAAHIINHDLALWSVQLHHDVMNTLRVWYRSMWVEPILLTLLLVMIATGIPMVAHYARQRMDALRVIQTATGVYVAVFLCSHIFATLNARRLGIETDWFFASGPEGSLLQGGGLLDRLIPHYIFATLALILHAALGLRIVLLQHGFSRRVANNSLYTLSTLAILLTAITTTALLGFHLHH